MNELQLLQTDAVIDVPTDVAVCPYCKAALQVRCEQWTEQDDGSWAAENVHAECTAEPDIEDEDEWEDWLKFHSDMPYVYQLPVDTRVEEWVKSHYRFDLK